MKLQKNISLLVLFAIGVGSNMTINVNKDNKLYLLNSTIRPTVTLTNWSGFDTKNRLLPSFGFDESTLKSKEIDKNTMAIIYDANSSGLPNAGIQGKSINDTKWSDVYYYSYLVKNGEFQTSIVQDSLKTPSDKSDDWKNYLFSKDKIDFTGRKNQKIGLGIVSWNNNIGDCFDKFRFYKGEELTTDGGEYKFINTITEYIPSDGAIMSIEPSTFGFDIQYNVNKNSEEGNVSIYVSEVESYIGNLVYTAKNQNGEYTQTIDNLSSNQTYYVTLIIDNQIYKNSVKTIAQEATISSFDIWQTSNYIKYTSGKESKASISGKLVINNPDNILINSYEFIVNKNDEIYSDESVVENVQEINESTFLFNINNLDSGDYKFSAIIKMADGNNLPQDQSITIEEQSIQTPTIDSFVITDYSQPTKNGEWKDGQITIGYNLSYGDIKFDSLEIKIYNINDTNNSIYSKSIDISTLKNGENTISFDNIEIGTYYATIDGLYTDTQQETLSKTSDNFVVEGKSLSPINIIDENLNLNNLSNDQLIKGSIKGTISLSDIDDAIITSYKPVINLYDDQNNLIQTINDIDYEIDGKNKNLTLNFDNLNLGKYHYSIDLVINNNSPTDTKTITLNSFQEYIIGTKEFNVPNMGFASAMDYDINTGLPNGLTLTIHSQSHDENNYWGDIVNWRSTITITYQNGDKIIKNISNNNDEGVISFSKTNPQGTINLPNIKSTIDNQIVSVKMFTEVQGENTSWKEVNLSSITGTLIPINNNNPINPNDSLLWPWLVFLLIIIFIMMISAIILSKSINKYYKKK